MVIWSVILDEEMVVAVLIASSDRRSLRGNVGLSGFDVRGGC